MKHCIHSQADLLENIARAGELAKRCNDTAPLRLMIVDSVAHLFRDPGQQDLELNHDKGRLTGLAPAISSAIRLNGCAVWHVSEMKRLDHGRLRHPAR